MLKPVDIRQVEISWYLKHGKYGRERMSKDSHGREYVIGDFGWNRDPKNKLRQEFVEPEMSFVL